MRTQPRTHASAGVLAINILGRLTAEGRPPQIGAEDAMAIARAMLEEPRRDRLLRFIAKAGGGRDVYAVRIGRRVVPHDRLTTDALENLAREVLHDFWLEKRLKRENGAH